MIETSKENKSQFGCNCVERLNKVVRDKFDPEGYLETQFCCDMKTGLTYPSLPPVFFKARNKDAKGRFEKRFRQRHFAPNFCPICGAMRSRLKTRPEGIKSEFRPMANHSKEADKWLWKQVEFQDEGRGVITNECADAIFIQSKFFTGWMLKAEYYALLGVEE